MEEIKNGLKYYFGIDCEKNSSKAEQLIEQSISKGNECHK